MPDKNRSHKLHSSWTCEICNIVTLIC